MISGPSTNDLEVSKQQDPGGRVESKTSASGEPGAESLNEESTHSTSSGGGDPYFTDTSINFGVSGETEQYFNELCPKGTSAEIVDSIRGRLNAFLEELNLGGGIAQDEPFFIKSKHGDLEYIIVPANYVTLLEHKEWRAIHNTLSKLRLPFRLSTKELGIMAEDEKLRRFLVGAMNRCRQDPKDLASLNFSGTKPHERGRIAVDTLILTRFSGVMNVENYLPDSTKLGKLSLLNATLAPLGGAKGLENLNALPSLIREAWVSVLKMHEDRWKAIALSSKIPFGDAVYDLLRRKNKKVKSKNGKFVEKAVPIHVEDPADEILAFFNDERTYLGSLSEPWDRLKEIHSDYKDGVPVSRLTSFRELYSAQYNKTFEISQSLNSWKARRREGIMKVKSAIKGKKISQFEFKPKEQGDILAHLATIIRDPNPSETELAILENFFPKHLLRGVSGFEQYNSLSLNVIKGWRTTGAKPTGIADGVWEKLKEWIAEIDPTLFDFTEEELKKIAQKLRRRERASCRKHEAKLIRLSEVFVTDDGVSNFNIASFPKGLSDLDVIRWEALAIRENPLYQEKAAESRLWASADDFNIQEVEDQTSIYLGTGGVLHPNW